MRGLFFIRVQNFKELVVLANGFTLTSRGVIEMADDKKQNQQGGQQDQQGGQGGQGGQQGGQGGQGGQQNQQDKNKQGGQQGGGQDRKPEQR